VGSEAKGEIDVRPMEIVRLGEEAYFLFLDLFVHASGTKITAVAPHYGDDLDWSEHGVDFEGIDLHVAGRVIRGKYVPHRLDSWEPAILIDFEDALLAEDLARARAAGAPLELKVEAGPHVAEFSLSSALPEPHEVTLSVIIRDENRWIGTYLDYYLHCLGADHVFVYDNETRDHEALRGILAPYQQEGTVTYLPWPYRWRNRVDNKQIGQPPQQAHSLERFGNSTWMGFFDVDEFLRIPDRELRELLSEHDPEEVDGLSFGLRWFFHQGNRAFEDFEDPLLEMLHCKRDELGRKRQKLFVSAKNVRFLRFHWLEEGKREVPIDDDEIFFHHYYNRPERYAEGLVDPAAEYDPYMLRFADELTRRRLERGSTRTARHRFPVAPKGESAAPVEEVAAPASRPRSLEKWITHVERAVDQAEAGRGGPSPAAHAVEGMCGRKNRIFLNTLCGFDGCRYLEVGSHAGASLSAALDGNRIDAIAIDDWSQFGGPRDRFYETLSRFRGESRVEVIEQDCFTVEPKGLGPVDVFFYDGAHSIPSQYKAIEHFRASLSELAVVVIDDWNWPRVRNATRQALDDLGLNVAWQKEIILPEADVEDMPRHRGAQGWWNGVCILLIDQRPGVEVRDVAPSEPVEVIVFSKDRACQLEALLRSMDELYLRPHHRTVLYTTSEPELEAGYEALARSQPGTEFVREVDFHADVLRLVEKGEARSRFSMFLVDDIVFQRPFEGTWHLQMLVDDPEVLSVSLRLGENVRFCHPRGAATVPPDLEADPRWVWREAHPGYWNYPMSVDGNLFRTSDLVEKLSSLSFRNPNTFESTMAANPIDRLLMASERTPVLVNLALNRVQDTYANPSADVDVNWLNDRFLAGDRIDLEPIQRLEADACHVEVELEWQVARAPLAHRSGKSVGTRIDLSTIPILVPTCPDHEEREAFARDTAAKCGLEPTFVRQTETDPAHFGWDLAYLRVLDREDLAPPFLILDDRCHPTAHFEREIVVPTDAELAYLGTSLFGLDRPGIASAGVWKGVEWFEHDDQWVRVYNMLSRHALLVLSVDARRTLRREAFAMLADADEIWPGDVAFAIAQESHRSYALRAPLFYVSERWSADHVATRAPLSTLADA